MSKEQKEQLYRQNRDKYQRLRRDGS